MSTLTLLSLSVIFHLCLSVCSFVHTHSAHQGGARLKADDHNSLALKPKSMHTHSHTHTHTSCNSKCVNDALHSPNNPPSKNSIQLSSEVVSISLSSSLFLSLPFISLSSFSFSTPCQKSAIFGSF